MKCEECGKDVQAEAAPNEEDLRLQVGVVLVDHVRRGVGDGEIEEPVRRGGH